MSHKLNKRYQVFVSSTFDDLQVERQQVIKALLELDCIPAGMELFPATTEDQWTLIKKVIDESDYYVVIVAGKYGSVDSSGMSFTEKEYHYAVKCNKPIMGFVFRDPESLPVRNTEQDPVMRLKQEQFRTLVKSRTCRLWTTSSELGAAVSASVHRMISDQPAVGWVRADKVKQFLPLNGKHGVDGQSPSLDRDLSVVLTEDKTPTRKHQISMSQCQLYLWDAGEFDVLWVKLVCSLRDNSTTPPTMYLTISPTPAETRDSSHMFFAMDSLLRNYQLPVLREFISQGTVSHVFYIAEPGKERERFHYAHPVPVRLYPARVKIEGADHGCFRLTPCDFLTYERLSLTKANMSFGLWVYCIMPKLLSCSSGRLHFACHSHISINRFRFQVALPFGVSAIHKQCSCCSDLLHPWLSANPLVSYPGWFPFISSHGQLRDIPIYFNPEPGINSVSGILVYGQTSHTLPASGMAHESLLMSGSNSCMSKKS